MEFKPEVDWNTVISLIGILVQIIGFGIAFFLIQYQFKEQRKIEKQNFKNQVNFDFYNKIISLNDGITFIAFVEKFVPIAEVLKEKDYFYPKVRHKIDDLIDYKSLGSAFHFTYSAAANFIFNLHNYKFILGNTELVADFMLSKLNDLLMRHSNMISLTKLYHLESTEKEKLPFYCDKGTHSPEGVNYIKELNLYNDAAIEFSDYIEDIINEFQNRLLGEYYNQKVQNRVSQENDIVIKFSDPKMLERMRDYIGEPDLL